MLHHPTPAECRQWVESGIPPKQADCSPSTASAGRLLMSHPCAER
jgi:hypothetical protein